MSAADAQRWFDLASPQGRDDAQLWLLTRHASLTRPKGTRRRTDAPKVLVKKYDRKGQRIVAA